MVPKSLKSKFLQNEKRSLKTVAEGFKTAWQAILSTIGTKMAQGISCFCQICDFLRAEREGERERNYAKITKIKISQKCKKSLKNCLQVFLSVAYANSQCSGFDRSFCNLKISAKIFSGQKKNLVNYGPEITKINISPK